MCINGRTFDNLQSIIFDEYCVFHEDNLEVKMIVQDKDLQDKFLTRESIGKVFKRDFIKDNFIKDLFNQNFQFQLTKNHKNQINLSFIAPEANFTYYKLQ